MALPNSGRLSLEDIATEFGGVAPHKLSEYYGSGNVPASGVLKLSDFYGESVFTPTHYITIGSEIGSRYISYGANASKQIGNMTPLELPGAPFDFAIQENNLPTFTFQKDTLDNLASFNGFINMTTVSSLVSGKRFKLEFSDGTILYTEYFIPNQSWTMLYTSTAVGGDNLAIWDYFKSKVGQTIPCIITFVS